jgi:hypothetical protein
MSEKNRKEEERPGHEGLKRFAAAALLGYVAVKLFEGLF